MASNPRSHTVQLGEVGVFHCWSRCVRRAWLCGMDPASGKDYEYRRNWICEFEELLASLFAVKVGFHAEESNRKSSASDFFASRLIFSRLVFSDALLSGLSILPIKVARLVFS